MPESQSAASPRWSRNTKLIISLVVVVGVIALLFRFKSLVGPVIFSFILAYLLHPLVSGLERKLVHSWKLAVNFLYLITVILLISLLTWGGLNLISQLQSLINLIQTSIQKLPDLISNLSQKIYQVGPFSLDLTKIDLTSIGKEVLSMVQPTLGRLGNLLSDLAGSAFSTFGWLAFILIVSYFILLESGGLREGIFRFNVPGYSEDIKRIGRELGIIWNAFLRGQFIIFSLTVIVYSILLPILGVRYALGLALLAGVANFLPYIGPAINWIALGLVTFFQVNKPFGLSPLVYTGVVIIIALLVDQVFNNLIIPRIMARALKVHPAAVLISAIIAANLIGFIGLLVAAPLLATLMLVGRYTSRKMLDREPWPAEEEHQEIHFPPFRSRLGSIWKTIVNRFSRKKN